VIRRRVRVRVEPELAREGDKVAIPRLIVVLYSVKRPETLRENDGSAAAQGGREADDRNAGLEVSPEQVVVFPGGKPSIGFCQEAYCNPGDEVIYPSPGFPDHRISVT
jgi:histidinol-phosphate/aromatic aminotransferase/cobyric acid decarboxylase-like protein